MTVVVEQYQDHPIIIATISEPVDYRQDIPDMFTRILELRDTLKSYSKYYTIVDVTGIKPNFSELLFSLGEARKASQKRRPEFPNEIHMVGSGELFEMAANALSQIQYGGYTAPLHANVEEALNAIRANRVE